MQQQRRMELKEVTQVVQVVEQRAQRWRSDHEREADAAGDERSARPRHTQQKAHEPGTHGHAHCEWESATR